MGGDPRKVTLYVTDISSSGRRRIHNWINTKSLEPMFGIQINTTRGRWCHATENNEVLLFRSEAEARAKAGMPQARARSAIAKATGGADPDAQREAREDGRVGR